MPQPERQKLYRQEMDSKTTSQTQAAKDRAKSEIWIRRLECKSHILYARLAPFFAAKAFIIILFAARLLTR
jgi:hypothetical protein